MQLTRHRVYPTSDLIDALRFVERFCETPSSQASDTDALQFKTPSAIYEMGNNLLLLGEGPPFPLLSRWERRTRSASGGTVGDSIRKANAGSGKTAYGESERKETCRNKVSAGLVMRTISLS